MAMPPRQRPEFLSIRRPPPAFLAMGVALIWVAPLRAQEAGGGLAAAAGPVGAAIGGGSLGDPADQRSASGGERVRLGPFGVGFAGADEAPEGPARAWNISPAITVGVGATNNVYQSSSDARSDLFFGITPSIVVDGSSTRVRATLSYAPSARLYATYTDQNNVAQIGNAQVLAELIPNTLFLDIRGSANLATASGGIAPGTAQDVQRNNQVQVYNFLASPYYVHRFGSFATAQVGYVFQSYTQTGTQQFTPGATQPFFNDQDYIANRGYAVVRSGEDFGRLALQARVDGTVFSGTGVYDGAHIFVSAIEARYVILPTIAVVAEGGYENIEYSGTDPQKINDALWSVGARWTPSPDSYLLIRYGHRGGFTSPSLEAGIQLGAYTRLTATYQESLGTSGTLAQDLLSATTLDSIGNPVDARTGAPVIYANPFFSTTSGLFRTKYGSAAITFTWPRDNVTVYASYQDQDPVSAAEGTQISQSTGYYGGVTWTHEITPRTAVQTRLQVGRTEFANSPATTAYFASAALYHRFTEKLSGMVQILYTNQSSNQTGAGFGQAVALAGVSRTF